MARLANLRTSGYKTPRSHDAEVRNPDSWGHRPARQHHNQGARGSNAAAARASPQNPRVTRSASSEKAQAIARRHPEHVTLVEGDAAAAHPAISSVFLVTAPPGDEAQAVPLIDAAVEHGVRRIFFSSVDRGGDAHSWDNLTSIPHFAAKHRIELHLRDGPASTASASGGATTTP
ncbi:hypothetical protein DL769_001374 [Monosporascus sp. CRB-8-3]|nr:hypothetical protein DL769_001374 [Monosporascus sp. CRB-8-3]